jgi:hypothetical protein
MIELDTIVGIAAFSLMLPAFVLQLLYSQSGALGAAGAYSRSFVANSKLQGAAASFASSNLTLSQARAALNTLFGDEYMLDANASAAGVGDPLASRILVIEGRLYYVRVYQDEIPNNS